MTQQSQSSLHNATVVRADGIRGRIVDQPRSGEPSPRVALQFDDGARVFVTATELMKQDDGTYLVGMDAMATANAGRATDEQVIPVIAEEIAVEKHQVERGRVHIHKRVETHDEVVDLPIVNEEIVVEHVAVNAVIEGQPPDVREEGDVLIIPVLEEVVVVEKRLMLREEVRVSRRRATTRMRETVTLRREVVDVERVEARAAPASGGAHGIRVEGGQKER
jgi:uncharacterized protein (TIGR02271 family)